MKPKDLLVAPDLRLQAAWAASRIELIACDAVERKGTCRVGLAGGATPRALYELLGSHREWSDLPWQALTFLFGDERCVPPGHADSNFAMARDALLGPRGIPEARIRRIAGEDPDPAHAAADYAKELAEPLDLLLLGVGADGHTASLFPGSSALDEREQPVVAVEAPTAPPTRRITITPPVIERADKLLVLASGERKAAAVARALEGPWDPRACPAQLARRGVWVLDPGAASGLRSTRS